MSPRVASHSSIPFAGVIEALGGVDRLATECASAFQIVSADAYREDLAGLIEFGGAASVVYLDDAVASMHDPSSAHHFRIAALSGLLASYEAASRGELASSSGYFLAYHLRRASNAEWTTRVSTQLRELLRWTFAFHRRAAESSAWMLLSIAMLETRCGGTLALDDSLLSRIESLKHDDELTTCMDPAQREEFSFMLSQTSDLVSQENQW